MGEAKFSYLDFISKKFSYSNERIGFAAVGVEHQNRARHIRKALISYDFSVHQQGQYFLFRFDLKKFRCFEERVSLGSAGLEHQNFAMRIPGSLKSYDISVHYEIEISGFGKMGKTFFDNRSLNSPSASLISS